MEAWLREAAQTLRLLPDTEVLAGLRSGHPEVYQTAGDLFAAEVERRKSGMPEDPPKVRLVAAPDSIKRMYVVFNWMVLFKEKGAAQLVWAKASGYSYRKISKIAGCSHSGVKSRWHRSLTHLTTALNKIERTGVDKCDDIEYRS